MYRKTHASLPLHLEAMGEFESLFQHQPEYRVIVCRKCQFAPVPSQIRRHLKDHHPQTSVLPREEAVRIVHSLPDLTHSPQDVVYPKSRQAPIDTLPIFFGGLRPPSKRARQINTRQAVSTKTTSERQSDVHSEDDIQTAEDHEDDTSPTSRPWATASEIKTLQRVSASPRPECLALFGRAGQLEKPHAIEECQAILRLIRTQEEEKNRYFESAERLKVLQQFSKWKNVGCQLCFVNTGELEPDHGMDECRL